MSVTLKRHFFISLMIIYCLIFLISRLQEIELPYRFLMYYPLFCLALFPPFRFSRERVYFTDGVIRQHEGEHIHFEMNIDDVDHVEGRSFFGLMPILSVIGKDKRQMVLSMRAEGAMELEDSLLEKVPGGDRLHGFFRFHRVLISETDAVDRAMVFWLRASVLFGIAVPILIWDEGLIAEQLAAVTMFWYSITVALTFGVLLYFALLNRFALLISPIWAEKNLTSLRIWIMLLLFFGYLAAGHQFCWRFFA